MKQPPGYEDKTKQHYLYRLDKALYGLKQAPRAWYSHLCNKLHSLGFVPSKADTSLFFYRKGNHVIFMLVYANDIIVASSSQEVVNALLQDLEKDFAIKDLGELHYLLGIQVQRKNGELLMSQERYASEILQRVNMQHCKSVKMPPCTSKKLSVTSGTRLGDKIQQDIGALLVHSNILPLHDLIYPSPLTKCVNFYIHRPPFTGKQRILRYIQGTISLGIKSSKSNSMFVSTFLDADWAGYPDDKRGALPIPWLQSNILVC
jgi:histone deacetylase 1/2